jgi:hypothetical protein
MGNPSPPQTTQSLVGIQISALPVPAFGDRQPWPRFSVPYDMRRKVDQGVMPKYKLGPLPPAKGHTCFATFSSASSGGFHRHVRWCGTRNPAYTCCRTARDTEYATVANFARKCSRASSTVAPTSIAANHATAAMGTFADQTWPQRATCRKRTRACARRACLRPDYNCRICCQLLERCCQLHAVNPCHHMRTRSTQASELNLDASSGTEDGEVGSHTGL